MSDLLNENGNNLVLSRRATICGPKADEMITRYCLDKNLPLPKFWHTGGNFWNVQTGFSVFFLGPSGDWKNNERGRGNGRGRGRGRGNNNSQDNSEKVQE